MKKFLIAAILIAAVAGAYFYFKKSLKPLPTDRAGFIKALVSEAGVDEDSLYKYSDSQLKDFLIEVRS